MAVYETTYKPGTLTAVNIRNGQEAETETLISASENLTLHAEADATVLRANGADLSYILVSLKDENGVPNLQDQKEIHVTVEGCAELAGFGSADPETDNRYDDPTWKTYDGYVLAAVRAGNTPGNAIVRFTSDDGMEASVNIQIK